MTAPATWLLPEHPMSTDPDFPDSTPRPFRA